MGRKHRKQTVKAGNVTMPAIPENHVDRRLQTYYAEFTKKDDDDEVTKCPFCDHALPDAYAPKCKHCGAFSVIDRGDLSPLIERLVAHLKRPEQFIDFLDNFEEYVSADVAEGIYWIRLPKQSDTPETVIRIEGPEYASLPFPLPVYRQTTDEEGYYMTPDASGKQFPDCRYCLHAARLRDSAETVDGIDYCARPLVGASFAAHFPNDYSFASGCSEDVIALLTNFTEAWLSTHLSNVEDDPRLHVIIGEHGRVFPVCKAYQADPNQDDFLDKIYEPTGGTELAVPVQETKKNDENSED